MSPSNFFVWKDADGTDHIISADLVQSALDVRQTNLTEHAIEDGSIVSDHVIRKPDTCTFELIQSQTPLYNLPFEGQAFQQREVTVEGRAAPPKKGLLSFSIPPSSHAVDTGNIQDFNYVFFAFSAETPRDRIRDMHDKLIELLDNSHEVEITFRGYTLQKMILIGLTSSSNPGELGMGRFSLEFQKLNTVTTQQGGDLPNPNGNRLKAKKKRQADAAKKVDEGIGESAASRLNRGLNLINVSNAGGF